MSSKLLEEQYFCFQYILWSPIRLYYIHMHLVGTANNGFNFPETIPNLPFLSMVFGVTFPPSFHSNSWINDPNIKWSKRWVVARQHKFFGRLQMGLAHSVALESFGLETQAEQGSIVGPWPSPWSWCLSRNQEGNCGGVGALTVGFPLWWRLSMEGFDVILFKLSVQTYKLSELGLGLGHDGRVAK